MTMKLVKPTPTPTAFFLPLRDVLAVWNATSTDAARYYLHGVLIEADGPDAMQIVATDGNILLRKTCAPEAHMGADVATQGGPDNRGFLLAFDTADKACRVKPVGDAWIYGDIETGIIQVLDVGGPVGDGYRRIGVVEFERIDGTFPDWRRIMPHEITANGAVCCDLALLARFQRASKQFATATYARITSAGTGDPMLVEFSGECGDMTGVLMPVRWT